MMVAALSKGLPNTKALSPRVAEQNPRRQPLAPSDASDNEKTKSRHVASRYLASSNAVPSRTPSSSSSVNPRRCPSPAASRPATATPPANSAVKRAQSAERRRPATPPNSVVDMSNAAKLLVSSTRRLSVSFQDESFSLPVNKAKPGPPVGSSVRKGTPERRRTATPMKDQAENSRPSDQLRWPGRSNSKIHTPCTRSVDFTGEGVKLGGSRTAIRSLHQSMIDEGRRATVNAKLKLKPETDEMTYDNVLADLKSFSQSVTDPVSSDTENVSSGSDSAKQERQSTASVRGGPRGIVVPARFWQETSNRARRTPEQALQLSVNDGVKKMVFSPKTIAMKKMVNDIPVLSPSGVTASRGSSSPFREPFRPAATNKIMTLSASSPSRRMPSPARVRSGMSSVRSNGLTSTSSILSFAADAKRGKIGETCLVDAHVLRLLHNRHLQWRYVNARIDAVLLAERESAEKSLYNAWVIATKLRHSVKYKRTEIHLLQQNLKLYSLLKGQMLYLDNWDLIQGDHLSSLSGAQEALEASILCLPLVSGARADLQDVHDAIHSAADIMHAMASLICSSLMKAEHVSSLVSKLVNVTASECALLDQCKELLSKVTAMQVNYCSMKTHILQLQDMVSSMIAEVKN